MSRLDDLIQELCPNGVDYKTISDISIKIVSGGTPRTGVSEYYNGDIPWLRTQEIDFNDIIDTELKITEMGVVKSSAKLIPENCVIVAMYGATVGKVAINKIPLTTNQACCNIQVNPDVASYKYVFYCLSNMYKYIKSLGKGSQTNINAQIVKELRIPIPPLEVQQEIVRLLDDFTAKTAELQAELNKEYEARKKQYEYYRDSLLTKNEQIPRVKLCDIATSLYRGAGIKRDQVTEKGIPCVRYGEIYTTYDTCFNDCVSHTDEKYLASPKFFEHGDILFAITGESVEDIAKSIAYLGHDKCLAGGDIVVMKHNQNPRYLAHVLSTGMARAQKSKSKVKNKVVHSSVPSIKQIEIPLPSLDDQKKYADILDGFYLALNRLQSELPAEIESRQKQYEFYRDKLLTFKELNESEVN